MSDVDLRHLTTMIAIAEEGTFSRAAARLGYTQSSVSQHIAALEKTVGGVLFDRPGGPKPVRLTPLGAVVLEQGRQLLSKAEALGHAVDRFKAGDGRIDVGTLQSVSSVILPTVLRRLRDEHPTCDIRLSEAEPDDAQIGDLDLLFYDGPISDDTEHVLLMHDPYRVVAHPGDLPAGPVPARELDGKPMVAWPVTSDQPRLEQALADAGAQPRIVFRSAGNDTILSMVRAGMGLAVLPWLAIHHVVCRDCGSIHGPEGWPDLRVHELDPTPTRAIYLHWPPGRSGQSPLAARAIEIAVEVARELAPAAR
ncbi:LysR family transcriptional regulator [Kibdelosporangium philippinense]|uniref:LysR family transcriptional regulator n=1 Tax=Kibdelosporangium philippinense TaxID=211113 RepID=A0ABS8ZA86_9PSEU|nr:LysR family transcriptional regulator [Kibdelosporangium philippinense]MCE7004059.1 LysR family transcriptional regulator [Kibdelosporangium philippinense]